MWRGQIEGVRIKSTKRRSGLGHKMFDWAIARCRDQGRRQLQLAMDKTRLDTLRFYESSLASRRAMRGMKLDLTGK